MGKIIVRSEHLSNMIAAGEVVERPSGIVKELVENSIDAHAHDIAIDIIQGGIESIVITDDGEGMDAQDATTAFERHATSKMKEENDYRFIVVSITDILEGVSYFVFNESAKEVLEAGYGIRDAVQGICLEGQVSRKKQIVPALINGLNRIR